MKLYYVYILQCADKSFYIGITNNLEGRLIEHKTGKSQYTSKRLPIKLKWNVACTNQNREAIKGLV